MLYTLPREVAYNPFLSDFPKKGWKYSLHAHKNRNGIHYDMMLSPPNQIIAYAWSTRTLPFKGKKVVAHRKRDRLRDDMEFEGDFITAKGYNKKKLLNIVSDAELQSIDDKGLNIKVGDNLFRIENVRGKKYKVIGT